MSGGISDLSGTIKIEGEKISVKFLPTVPSASQGTIEWNIPTPVEGCASQSHIDSAYCGIVIVASRSPLGPSNIPTNGIRYTADPTLDVDLHAGDTISNALVIGAFYEGDLKANGLELTTSLIVNDYDSEDNYYIGTYAVSCTLEYHSDGIRAYSDVYGDAPTPNRPSISPVELNDGEGVKLTDGTNLEAGRQYGFEFDLNTHFPKDTTEDDRITVMFDGSEGQTYADMLDTINDQLKEIDNPPKSAVPPNTNSLYWNTSDKTLKSFNGSSYDSVDDVIVGTTDPSITPEGFYWFDEETKQLKRRNSNLPPSTDLWDDITTIVNDASPTNPECDQIWFDGKTTYRWCGDAWCELTTYIQDSNPSLYKTGICGQYWFNESTDELHRYNINTFEWDTVYAIYWKDAPDSLGAGTLWYSTTDQALRTRVEFGNVKDWNIESNFVIGEVEPVPTAGLYWYRESTNSFFQYNDGTFEIVDVLEWHEEPNSVTSCELWWDENTDVLHVFDVVNLNWQPVSMFSVSDTDPLAPEVIADDSFWLDTLNNVLNSWDGTYFTPFYDYIDYPHDPIKLDINSNVAWYDSETDTINVPDGSGGWIPAEPLVTSDYDPEKIPVGNKWFDEATDSLMMWNGIAWINVPYTTKPISNKVGELWLDSTTGELKQWNGKEWVIAPAKVTAGLDSRGNLMFTTRDTGSCIALLMLVPEAENIINLPNGISSHAIGHNNVYTDNPYDAPKYLEPKLRSDQFLFNSLPALVHPIVVGTDTLETQPSYAIQGVGTDGTPDERRELAHTIRVQLGYPTVDVELTDEHLDTAISRSIEELRQRSDVAYRRSHYLLDIRPGIQNYQLTNKKIGFDKIVYVMKAHRRSGGYSAVNSGNAVFDQMFAQQLYGNTAAGGFDMTTMYLSQQYVELIEMMFAHKLGFHFNETNRTLYFHQDFHRPERILLDTAIERTEQDMLKDRLTKPWLERHSLALSRMTLAEIRGKYAALPGAGGGVSLNASDLMATAASELQECYQQLDDMVASNAEHFGSGIIMG